MRSFSEACRPGWLSSTAASSVRSEKEYERLATNPARWAASCTESLNRSVFYLQAWAGVTRVSSVSGRPVASRAQIWLMTGTCRCRCPRPCPVCGICPLLPICTVGAPMVVISRTDSEVRTPEARSTAPGHELRGASMIGPQQKVPSRQQVRSRADRTDGALGVLPLALPSAGLANLLRRLWRHRALRFGAVAASCTLGQLLILAWLARLGVSEVVANGIGFGLSAQANFVLSAQVTWRDRKPHPVRPARTGFSASLSAWPARWARFNTGAIAALAVNELVFTMGVHAGIQLFMASSAGIVAGAALTFTLNNLVTFRDETMRKSVSAQLECRPGLEEISGRAQQDGVAFFL